MRRKTRAELEEDLKTLDAMREFLACVNRGDTYHARAKFSAIDGGVKNPTNICNATFSVDAWRLESGEGDQKVSIDVVGVDRGAGGVIFRMNGEHCTPIFLCDWCHRLETAAFSEVYARDLAYQARKLQAKVIGEKKVRA